MKATLGSEGEDCPKLRANDVITNCPDFKEELGAMQTLNQSSGNIVLFTSSEALKDCWHWH